MRIAVIAGLAAALAGPACAQTLDQDRQSCMRGEPDAQIAGCTADILSGQETPRNLAVAYANRAAAYDAKGRHDQAIADATRALELNPSYADAHNVLAWAYHGLGRDAEGLPQAEQAVALAPGDAYARETLGEIHERLGRRDEAAADYRATLAIMPQMNDAIAGLKRLGARP